MVHVATLKFCAQYASNPGLPNNARLPVAFVALC